jgi:ferredoxin
MARIEAEVRLCQGYANCVAAADDYFDIDDDRRASLSGIVVVNWPRALIAGRKALAHNMSYADVRQAIEQLLSTVPAPVAMEGAK